MKKALLILREMDSKFSYTERNIARYIRENPNEITKLSVRELAEKTFSSPSSVIRLCRRSGFEGFKDFKQSLLLELAILGQDTFHSEKDISSNDSIETIIQKVTEKNIQSLKDTRHLLNPETVSQSVTAISRAETILLFGIGASLCVAKDAYLKFLRLNKPCIFNEDWHSQLIQAKNSSEKDIALIFSFSGQTKEIIECMKELKNNGTPCITITRYLPSPVAKMSDYLLYVASNESTFRSGAMSSRLSQLNVVDIIYSAFCSAHYEYCINTLARTHIHKDNN